MMVVSTVSSRSSVDRAGGFYPQGRTFDSCREYQEGSMTKFEKIAREAIEKAEKINCPFDKFVEGLRDMLIALRERLDIAEDELTNMTTKK